ncbi:CpaF family protein [Mycetocola reblochoni]
MSGVERAVEDVVRRVQRRIGADADRDEVAELARRESARRAEQGRAGRDTAVPDERALERSALAALLGYGALQPLLDDPAVEEIWINSPRAVFASAGGVTRRVPLELTAQAVRETVERMLQTTGRRLDLSSPFVDASLPDGSRLHVVIPDITAGDWAVNIRKFLRGTGDIDALVGRGMIPADVVGYLRGRVAAGGSIVVSGSTHTGKTTLLGAMLTSLCATERILTVEETFELSIRVPDRVGLQGREANLEGSGAVDLRRLIREALRMRPDRLVVGEVRGAEALDLLIAVNTGVPGGCTVHANSAGDALRKLTLLPLLAGTTVDRGFVVECIAAGIDTVVHLERDRDGARRVAEVAHPELGDGGLTARTVYRAEQVPGTREGRP